MICYIYPVIYDPDGLTDTVLLHMQFLVKSICDWIRAPLVCTLAVFYIPISSIAITVTTMPAKPKQKAKEKVNKVP